MLAYVLACLPAFVLTFVHALNLLKKAIVRLTCTLKAASFFNLFSSKLWLYQLQNFAANEIFATGKAWKSAPGLQPQEILLQIELLANCTESRSWPNQWKAWLLDGWAHPTGILRPSLETQSPLPVACPAHYQPLRPEASQNESMYSALVWSMRGENSIIQLRFCSNLGSDVYCQLKGLWESNFVN